MSYEVSFLVPIHKLVELFELLKEIRPELTFDVEVVIDVRVRVHGEERGTREGTKFFTSFIPERVPVKLRAVGGVMGCDARSKFLAKLAEFVRFLPYRP